MSDFVPAAKDRAVFIAWVVGLVLLSLLLWSLTYPFRADCLMRATNKVLITMNDARRLASPLAHPPAGTAPLGCWYRLAGSDSLFFVFTIMREGILVPCGAEISPQGDVNIVPLGNHARQLIEKIPQSVVQAYLYRIKSVSAQGGLR